ncbi:hypothetical protein F2P79_025183 [Pimephales promelas]|nr:hypothetical protein F2P79_025183 [Pimephales promelas]
MSAWLSVYRSAAKSPVRQQPFHKLSVRPVTSNQSSGPVIIIGAESGQWEQYPCGGGSLDVCSDCVFTSVVKFFEVCVNPARVIGVFPMDAHRWSY